MLVRDVIRIVRKGLKDVETDTQKGQFYSDTEITFAIRQAINTYFDYAIKMRLHGELRGLIRGVSPTRTPVLPNDFGWIISGRVGPDENNLFMAQIFINGQAYDNIDTNKAAILIINNQVIFRYRNIINPWGEFYYYKQPEQFPDNPDADYSLEFPLYVFDNAIIPFAMILLGFKETQNSRNYKTFKRFVEALIMGKPEGLFNITQNFGANL